MSKKKILVTGAAGFLGSNLIDQLIVDGNEVIGIDNLSTGSYAKIRHLKDHPNFTFYNRDVKDPYQMDVDQIYNLACPASPIRYQEDPIDTIMTCFDGMVSALACGTACNATILQASTSEIYGDPAMHPQLETYWGNVNPIGVRSCYDEGKRIAETLCFDYQRSYGTDIRVARIFNTYGPRMEHDDGRVVSNFVNQAIKGEPITIYGDGSQSRSFCYVDDMVAGLIALMNSDYSATPVNLGNPEEFTMHELANYVLDLTGSKSQLVQLPLPQDDPKQRQPNINLAKQELGWESSVELVDGLATTIEYFLEQ